MVTLGSMIKMGCTVISASATAYHSGATASEMMIVPSSTIKDIESALVKECVGFGELDGKHSEVFGGIILTPLTESNAREMLLDYMGTDGSDQIREILGSLLSLEDYDECVAIDSIWKYNLSVTRTVMFKKEIL